MQAAPQLYLGTSSWTAPSWVGPFYPPGTKATDFLPHYARRFRCVEVDSTWYASPSSRTVAGWREKTPEGFVFAAKVPQVITHQKILTECEADQELFVEAMRGLGSKAGPLLLQFPYFKATVLPNLRAFLARLEPFLALLPGDLRFAVEIRNKAWLQPALFGLLRRHRVALAWIDHPYMPRPRQMARLPGAVTADWLYVRWLGDRHGIERVTTTWDRIVVDRAPQLAEWAEVLKELVPVREIYGFHNNHYGGSGFQTAEEFRALWGAGTEP